MTDFNAINWKNYEDAYGLAQEVPSLLQNLHNQEPNAWYDIWSHLCHQGTVYNATFIAMPFIVNILEENLIKNKEVSDFYFFATYVELFFHECNIDISFFKLSEQEIINYQKSLEKLDNLAPQFIKDNKFDCVLGALAYQAIRAKKFTLV